MELLPGCNYCAIFKAIERRWSVHCCLRRKEKVWTPVFMRGFTTSQFCAERRARSRAMNPSVNPWVHRAWFCTGLLDIIAGNEPASSLPGSLRTVLRGVPARATTGSAAVLAHACMVGRVTAVAAAATACGRCPVCSADASGPSSPLATARLPTRRPLRPTSRPVP